MATPSVQLDLSSIEQRLREVVAALLAELGNERASAAVQEGSHLDRDLGLGSLERVELLVRLNAAFHIRLADRILADADTIGDLRAAVAGALSGETASPAGDDVGQDRAFRFPTTELHRAARSHEAPGVRSAETWQEVLRYRASRDAQRVHIQVRNEDDSETSITFGELYQRAEGVAGELVRRGVAAGDRVAIMLPTAPEFFYTFAGTLLAGAVPVPIYPPFRADRIEEYARRQSAILENSAARLLVTFREAEALARLLKPRVPSLAGVVAASRLAECSRSLAPPPLLCSGTSADIALLQYTSGSTGDPKGVVLTHRNLLANVRAVGDAVRIRADDVIVSWLPLYHDMGLIGAWLVPLYFGLPVSVLSPLAFLTRPERWLWTFHRCRGTLGAAPNFAFELCTRKIAEPDIEGLDLSSIRAILNGAEPVYPDTLERFRERFSRYGFRPEAMLPVYGLAEASLAVTIPTPGSPPRVDRIERDTFERTGRAQPAQAQPRGGQANVISFVSVGRAIPGHQVRVVDAQGCDAGERTEGALWFRGPSATREYYRNEKATRALFAQEDWLDSGDRAYQADREIYVTGRAKDIIIKGGRNLYPHEIEQCAARVEGVRNGCVVAFGIADQVSSTERLVVVAELRDLKLANDGQLRSRVASTITENISAALGLPPDIVELLAPHSIPKTSSGKLRREETKRLYLAGKLGSDRTPKWIQIATVAAMGARSGFRRGMVRSLEVSYGLYASLLFGAWMVPSWLLVLAAPSRRAAGQITLAALRVYMLLVGCRIRVLGRDLLKPHEGRVLVANHASYFDVLALMTALGTEDRFVAKRELTSMPFIRTWVRKLGHFAFDRNDPQARLRQAEEIEQALRRGDSVCIFPEGTFTPQAGVRPFQLGAFKAAAVTGRPIYPIALCGTRRFLRDQTYLPRPARVTLTICSPLEPDPAGTSDWHEIVRLRDAARAAIAQHTGEPPLEHR